jgi:hypothetical protein
MVQDMQKNENFLIRIYKALGFAPDEIKELGNSLAGAQQLAVSTELLRSFTDEEKRAINESAQKSDEEKKAVVDRIAKAHITDDDFKSRAQDEVKKVLDEHIAYLKTCGDTAQKAEIAKILAEVG